MHPLVDPGFLSAHPSEVRIADVRWSLTGPSGWEKYRKGHIPGPSSSISIGISPVRVVLAATLRRRRTSPASSDASASVPTQRRRLRRRLWATAARFWFLLKVHGHDRASVLDGGLQAWTAAGLPVTTEETRVSPTDPPLLVLDRRRLAEHDEVEALVARRDPGTVLTDARAPERYRGEVEPVDPRAGHIPSAINAPVAANLRNGRFLPAAELRALYEKIGAGKKEIVASCGSGVTACHTLLALDLAGLPPGRLYVGSFSDWSSRKDARVATGSEPG
jgi:thiosulfate/3-mercaptopyruvate sulfurtransferase